jgi:NADH-quinone oxidoreductase subunit D
VTIEATSTSGERMTLNMGPQHPATHGVLRIVVESDGEVVANCKPDHGYLHRSIEKIGECVEWQMFVPYTDRVDYVCAMNANLAYCVAAEKLFATDKQFQAPGAAPFALPLRAECIRILVAELNRISSHLVAVGAMAMDVGAYTPFMHGIAQRELVNDIFEKVCGQRLTYNYITIGGVAFDLHPEGPAEITRFLDQFEGEMQRFNKLITSNTIFRDRLAGVAAISAEDAIAWSLAGPNLRGSGVDWDIRRDEPYGIYGRLGVRVATGQNYAGRHGKKGDCYDRYVVRLLEIQESVRLCREALKLLPPPAEKANDPIGGWQADVDKLIKRPPKGEIHCRTEAPRGEMGYFIVSDGTKVPWRMRVRTGSFTAAGIFEKIMRGIFLADVVAVIGSLDIVVPEIDR